MAGYQQHSYDPLAGGEYGPPLRPFNWVQWLGVGIEVLSGMAILAWVLGRVGAISIWIDDLVPAVAFMPVGALLINSRRETVPLSPEAICRRSLILAVALVICALAAALVILFKGV